ncbi:D-2-hydroxyglutarate dehydrogenase, mitochondrial-like [Galleria mellonella]|uniref:D-2-hydroxyglutarate dehydrogenase, mitochondrial n=1 Tax=Galleria mellonella TaxID=7137 RepID=A0A6J1WCZ7_GALME|nr:D-2-hydroxyglutarate dehydrogenase, mitochondrial-like [Galleria mellonella]
MLNFVNLFVRHVTKQNVLVKLQYSSQVLPQFSSEKYNKTRKDFTTAESRDLDYFKKILGAQRVLTEDSDVLPFNVDWFKNCRGQSKIVLKPKSVQEVSQILSYCNQRKIAICPQGGNTSVVGGGVPMFDEVILNLSLMNQIISLDAISGTLVCEAGCILENLDNYVREHELIMPIDLGAKGTCHIGGNVSTNAGGIRLLRYGNLHGSILGVEAVKADGTIINCLKTLKKDNTGYHLKHLFIGSEGTLGVVTKVAIHCPVKPKSVTVGFFGLDNFKNILKLYRSAKSSLGEILSAFEMIDREALNSSAKYLNQNLPISEYPFYVLVETHGSNETHDEEKLTQFLSKEMESGLILDGTVTSEPGKMQYIWRFRESIPAADLAGAYLYTYDVSLPQNHYYEIVPLLRERLGDKATKVCGFGHIGDGNIHIDVVVPEYSSEITNIIEPFLFEEVAKRNGSVSAEHGVGCRKPHLIHYSVDEDAIQLMRDLKNVMDPNGILNPYKVLPDVYE